MSAVWKYLKPESKNSPMTTHEYMQNDYYLQDSNSEEGLNSTKLLKN